MVSLRDRGRCQNTTQAPQRVDESQDHKDIQAGMGDCKELARCSEAMENHFAGFTKGKVQAILQF